MLKKPTILVFNKYYVPGFRAGGPVKSLAILIDRLGDEFDFHVICGDRDVGDSQPYASILLNTWQQVGKARVRYVDVKHISLNSLKSLIEEIGPDSIYLNSFFATNFTLKVLFLRKLFSIDIPIILAPRGEFSPAALAIKKYKKKLYRRFVEISNLCGNITWHATSEHEVEDILSTISINVLKSKIHKAPSFTPLPLHSHTKKLISPLPLRICFLSRISPMKNLEFALEVLANVKASVIFSIYGPISDGAYWERCKKIIPQLPSNIKVIYKGAIEPASVLEAMQENSLFFLPTLGENYGHVIREALLAGLPVLISNRTPWNDVANFGVGWAIDLSDVGAFTRTIEQVALWNKSQHRKVNKQALDYAIAKSADPHILDSNRAMFRATVESLIR